MSNEWTSLDVPQEPPALIESNRAPAYWPSNSPNKDLLVVENLEVKYAPELPAVIKDVSFSLKAGERVGLLGRTGMWPFCLYMLVSIAKYGNILLFRKRKVHFGDQYNEIRALSILHMAGSRSWKNAEEIS